MAGYKPNSFGSPPFLSGMASLFRSQTEILDELIEKPLSEAIRHVTSLLGAIRDNCKAMLLLEKTGLLNELTLVQRLFTQRLINCCYLLNAGQDEVSHYFSNPIASSGDTLRDGSADAFLEFSKGYTPKDVASAFPTSLREQIDRIAQKTGVPKDLFLVALASIFPKSSEILAGSLYGTVFQFGVFNRQSQDTQDSSDFSSRRNEEFCTLLLNGVGLLDALFKIVAQREPIEALKKRSIDNLKSARQLMESRHGNTALALTPADGAWERLDSLEISAQTTIAKQLQAFEAPFRDAYEAGVIVPVLRSKGRATIDVRSAALLFKRVLNDLRGVWVLLRNGYTSQAAAVAASLYESSLASICLLQSNENIAGFLADPHGEIPWNITEMAKMVVRGEGKQPRSKEFENSWRALYAHYSWLCQIKHSGRDSVVHDTTASTLAENRYVVMAIPNVRKEDLAVKAMVAIISLQQTLECIEAFAHALGFRERLPDDFRFAERFQRARDSAWQAFEPHLNASQPISIAQSRFTKKHPPVE